MRSFLISGRSSCWRINGLINIILSVITSREIMNEVSLIAEFLRATNPYEGAWPALYWRRLERDCCSDIHYILKWDWNQPSIKFSWSKGNKYLELVKLFVYFGLLCKMEIWCPELTNDFIGLPFKMVKQVLSEDVGLMESPLKNWKLFIRK